jgi:hypothetical protein
MNRFAGIVVLVAGLVLVGWGLNVSDSVQSGISRLFTGSPTDKAVYLVAGGALLAIVGGSMAIYRGKARA